MGGKPLTAMNIVAFPSKKLDKSILKEILNGGIEKIHEAGAVLVGGHSIKDDEIKYGLSITGIVSPDKIISVKGAKPGDAVILTKPVGTGIIATALKGEIASNQAVNKITRSMVTLNKYAAEAMIEIGVNACTDITGFSLIGHAYNMINSSGTGMKLFLKNVPVFKEAIEYSSLGLVPAGTKANLKFYEHIVREDGNLKPEIKDILFDAQTSGGLLISVSPDRADNLLNKLKNKGVEFPSIIGEIIDKPTNEIVIVSEESSVIEV